LKSVDYGVMESRYISENGTRKMVRNNEMFE